MTSIPAALVSRAAPIRTARAATWALALVSLLTAVALYTRFSLDDELSRDEAISAYGAQQWARGVPFYTSIFDAKGPLSSALGGVAVWVSSLLGGNDLTAIRLLFLVMACATVAGVYVLAWRAWASRLAGLAAAATFVSFRGFAVDAIGGPDPKVPGTLFAVAALALLLRRRWFTGSLLAGLAALVWQPLGIYAVAAVAAAALGSDAGARMRCAARAAAGALAPVAATVGYYLVAGSLGALVQGMVVFPFTGVERKPETLGDRLGHIGATVDRHYGDARVLLWGGIVLLVILIARQVVGRRVSPRDPLVVAVAGTGAGVVAFTLSDFQGYPDLFPLLPYAALGVGGALGHAVRAVSPGRARRIAGGLGTLAVVTVVATAWRDYTQAAGELVALRPVQQAAAGRLERLAGPGGTIWVLGDPAVLVLTGRRNPSPFIYLNSGFDRYVAEHTPGGLTGFARGIIARRPDLVVLSSWTDVPRRRLVLSRLRSAYRRLRAEASILLVPRRGARRAARPARRSGAP